jgi:hypothetical protein
MDVILGALLGFLYLYGMFFLFRKITRIMEKKTNDFVKQILPGWLIVALTCAFINLVSDLPGTIYFNIMLYVSLSIISILLFLLLIVKNININMYNWIIEKLRKND